MEKGRQGKGMEKRKVAGKENGQHRFFPKCIGVDPARVQGSGPSQKPYWTLVKYEEKLLIFVETHDVKSGRSHAIMLYGRDNLRHRAVRPKVVGLELARPKRISFSENSSKLPSYEAFFLAQGAPQAVWWPGSARTRWGSLQLD